MGRSILTTCAQEYFLEDNADHVTGGAIHISQDVHRRELNEDHITNLCGGGGLCVKIVVTSSVMFKELIKANCVMFMKACHKKLLYYILLPWGKGKGIREREITFLAWDSPESAQICFL